MDFLYQLIHDDDLYHIEISPLVCSTNQWTSCNMIGIPFMKELKH